MKRHDTILLVDDEREILDLLESVIAREEYRIIKAYNASEGLKVLEKTPVSLVISDQNMGGMNGIDFLELVKDRWPDTIRIILTGFPNLDYTIRAINKDIVHRYLLKPIGMEEICKTVEEFLAS